MILIIVLSIVFYYILGFLSLVYLDEFDEISIMGVVFGLSIIPIACVIYCIITNSFENRQNNKEKQNIKVVESKYKNYGIIKANNYLAYNFPDEKYMGYIKIDIREVSYKEIDNIIDRLNKWAENEIKKIAKIRALEEISKNSM